MTSKKLPQTVDCCDECPFQNIVEFRCTLTHTELVEDSNIKVNKDCPLEDVK